MGLLTIGKPLNYEETMKFSACIREHGITQFLSTWKRVKDIKDDELKFGDEIECGVFVIDSIHKTVKLSIRSTELRAILSSKEDEHSHQTEGASWQPEFGAWMIESTPSRPYSNYANDLLRVERNMILRRRRLLSVLASNEIAPTVTSFFLLGTENSIENPKAFETPNSESIYLPDYVINPHPRFAALTSNVRHRRGKKVDIRAPLYRDTYTPEFLCNNSKISSQIFPENFKIETDESIHMDCMAFGMGMCCLQVTFQARDVDESRFMYDQLAVLAPIMLAMTAATPIFKGRLSDVDARWNIIAQSVDDRTDAEQGLIPDNEIDAMRRPGMAGEGVKRLYKSRYDSISTYIYHCKGDPKCKRTFEVYNDIPCPIDETVKDRLLGEGLDENLSHHLAHLFTRDPLVVFEGMIELDDTTRTEHFENIQSTNWNTCRWKPPPPRLHPEDPHIGWRTEFRSMEVQFTDFENAAFTVFIVLITRVVLAFDLALYIPLSKVDENMRRSQQRDALNKHKFYFRKHVAPEEDLYSPHDTSKHSSFQANSIEEIEMMDGVDIKVTMESASENDYAGFNNPCNPDFDLNGSYEEMTMDEIFNGKDSYYPGLIPLVYAYLDYINCERETFHRIDQYLTFISRRAKGELKTEASWIREQVMLHPKYKHDSIISQEIAYDILIAVKAIGEGKLRCPEILGDVVIEPIRSEDAYEKVLAGRLTLSQRSELLERLVSRAHLPRQGDLPRGQQASFSSKAKSFRSSTSTKNP